MQVWHPHGYFRTGLIISKWPRLSLIILSSRFPKSFFGGISRAASCRSKHNTNTTLSTQSSELQVIRHNTNTTLSTRSRELQVKTQHKHNTQYSEQRAAGQNTTQTQHSVLRAESCSSKHNTNTTLSTQSRELQVKTQHKHNTHSVLRAVSCRPARQGNFIYTALFYKRQTQSASHTINTSVRVM